MTERRRLQRLEAQRRYEASPKGRATQERYNASAKGVLRNIDYDAKRRGN